MGNETVKIDRVTGLRATASTPQDAIIEKVITDVHDILYWVNKSDPRGAVPSNPASDPQFRLWEPSVQTWWAANAKNYPNVTTADIPAGTDTTTGTTASPLTLSGLPDRMNLTDNAEVTVNTSGQYPLTSVDVLIDNSYIATLPSPFHFVFTPDDFHLKAGSHSINSVFAKSSVNQLVTFVQGT
jgi:hypothetical protein